MQTPRMDIYGRETGRHYDLSDKSYDIILDRMARVFQTMKLVRFGTFEEFMRDPAYFYSRASSRGDFWG